MAYSEVFNQFPDEFHARMIGKLLGDGTITKQIERKARFQFSHVDRDKGWTTYCYQNLRSHCPLNPPTYRKIIDQRLRKGFSESYIVQSRTNFIFDALEAIWYINRKKTLPIDYIARYFNSTSLAWWYQDDGYLKQDNNFPRKIILSTECFAEKEISYLRTLLLKKYQLNFSIDKQNRLVLYNAASIFHFLSLIEKYLQPALIRKTIGSRNFQLTSLSAKRTTIYLPIALILNTPTKEINDALIHLESIWNSYKNGEFYRAIHEQNSNWLLSLPPTKSYQIIISSYHLELLHLLKMNTGLTYSQLANICFRTRDNLFHQKETLA